MSIEGKHAYRFGYLKSEQWSTVRIEALAREKGKCQICFDESISNDAHHIWYPQNIFETREEHLVILCRPCHDFIHLMMPECKTSVESEGREMWLKFRNAIITWRAAKQQIFHTPDGIPIPASSLRARLETVSRELAEYKAGGILVSESPVPYKVFDKFMTSLKEQIHNMEKKFRPNEN